MKAAATVEDVEALRVTFALEAEEWFVEQFDDMGRGKAYLERYLGRPMDRLLTGEERERLSKHLGEVRKQKHGGGGVRIDGKPRKRSDGAEVYPDGTVVFPPTTKPGGGRPQ